LVQIVVIKRRFSNRSRSAYRRVVFPVPASPVSTVSPGRVQTLYTRPARASWWIGRHAHEGGVWSKPERLLLQVVKRVVQTSLSNQNYR
jgi:hypothetical protein